MASRHLQLIEPENLADIRSICFGLQHLRDTIVANVGAQEGVNLSLSKDLSSIDVAVYLKTDAPFAESVVMLKLARSDDLAFRDVEVRPVPNKPHRKMIVAKAVHPTDADK